MSRNIKDINFDDIDISECKKDIKEINEAFESLYKDPKIKKLLKKNKKLEKLYKITNFFEMIINYGLWKTITGNAKKEELTEFFDYLDGEIEEDD